MVSKVWNAVTLTLLTVCLTGVPGCSTTRSIDEKHVTFSPIFFCASDGFTERTIQTNAVHRNVFKPGKYTELRYINTVNMATICC